MGLGTLIEQDCIEALKGKNELALSVLRMLKSAIKNKEISLVERRVLTDEEIIGVVQKEIKQRKDSAEQYILGNRQELADKEKKEIVILEKYLPSQLSETEIIPIITAIIKEVGAKSPSDIGKVMPKAMSVLKGKTDGAKVSQIVQDLLKG